MQCPEAKCVPANSSQSTGLIEFSEEALHVFSGPMDVGLHLIMEEQNIIASLCLWTLHSQSFFNMSSWTKGKGRIYNVNEMHCPASVLLYSRIHQISVCHSIGAKTQKALLSCHFPWVWLWLTSDEWKQ